MNTALVFVCSPGVDAYINAICYLSDKRNVTRFRFIFITGAMMEGPSTDFVKEEIVKALNQLAEGMHRGRNIGINQKTKDNYRKVATDIQASPNLVESISLEELREKLTKYVEEVKPRQVYIDVTGLPKILMSHVMLISLVGGYQVYAFELRQKVERDYPERSLYWSMQGGFDYPPLTRDPAVQSSYRQLVHVRRVVQTIAAASLVGVGCFSALLVIDSNNATLALIGLAANVIGIASGLLQALMTNNS